MTRITQSQKPVNAFSLDSLPGLFLGSLNVRLKFFLAPLFLPRLFFCGLALLRRLVHRFLQSLHRVGGFVRLVLKYLELLFVSEFGHVFSEVKQFVADSGKVVL